MRKSDMLTLENGHSFAYEHIGEFHAEDQWIHPTRTINSYELIFVLEGTVPIMQGDRSWVLRPNQTLLLYPGVPHAGTEPVGPPVAFYWFHFRTDLPLNGYMDGDGDYYDLKQQLKRLLHIANTPLYDPAAADAAGLLILQELLHRQAVATTDDSTLAHRVAEYVRGHAAKPLTVGALAAFFGYHPDHISRVFRRRYGVSLKRHLTAQRLHAARDLLLTTDLSIKQIAARMSFANENTFIKFFLYHEEITPARFRNLYCGTHINNN